MKVLVYDIEVFGGMFLFCAMDPETKEKYSFELSRRADNLDSMIQFLQEKQAYRFVGYNNLSYDSQVVEYIIRSKNSWSSIPWNEIMRRIKDFSNEVIEGQDYGEWSPFRERELSFKQIDLFKIHHFDNKSRRTSLKWIGFSINAKDIEELPFPHYKEEFTDEEFQKVIDYCWKDIDKTYNFYLLTRGNTDNEFYKGRDKIQDRIDLIEELQFPDEAINFSDVKLGDEINKRGYCRIKGINERQLSTIRKSRKSTRKLTFGGCIPEYVRFQTDELKDFLRKISPIKVNMNEDSKQSFDLHFRGSHYVIARGGIHTKDKPRVIIPLLNEILRDADVQSQHPNAICKRKLYPDHLGPEWLISYNESTVVRAVYKEKGKTDRRYKGLSETYKLALNGGGFGKTIDKTNWQYGPEVGFSCTIGNQFEILMLAEMLEISGIKVVSANTDGVLCLFDKSLEEVYKKVCLEWEIIVGNSEKGKLEFTDFSRMYQESVGHYIAVLSDGTLKIKGRFAVDGEVNKNNTKDLGRIERKAIVKYFSQGVPIEETIRGSRNIFDFFIGMKVTKDYHYETVTSSGEIDVYKRIIRFYISKSGAKLIKIKNEESEATGSPITRIVDGYLVRIMNEKLDLDWEDYNIDYDYYIDNAYRVVGKIEGTLRNQARLF